MVLPGIGLQLDQIPTSTLIIIMAALGVNLVSSLGRRFLTDMKEARRIRVESRAYRAELKQAMLSGNKAKVEKLKKKEPQIRRMEMKLSSGQMKVSLVFIIPLFLIFQVLSTTMGTAVVAFSPIVIPILPGILTVPTNLEFFYWYFISSIALSGVVTKALGVGLD